MAEDRAVISAEMDGAGKVIADAKKISGALRGAEKDAAATAKAAEKAGDSTGGLRGLGAEADALRSKLNPQALLGGVLGGFVASGIGQVMSLVSAAADKAQSFGETTSRTARRAGLDLGALRATVKGNETATLQGADAQADFVAALAKTSYNGKGAMASLRSVGYAATASGRDLSELVPVVASIQDGLNVKGDVGDELQRLGDLAQRLKSIGGPQALQDGIAALRPALQQINIAGAGARANLEAFFAVLSSNRRPGAAQSVVSGAIGLIKGRSTDVERTLKRNVINDDGEVEKPLEVLEDLQKHLRNRYKGNKAAQRRASIAEFGPELGTAIYATDFGKVKEEGLRSFGGSVVQLDAKTGEIADARRVAPSSAQEEAEAYKLSREGRRQAREVRAGQVERNIGDTALSIKEAAPSVLGEPAGGAVLRSPTGQPLTLRIEDQAALAKSIGKETADALRAVPPKVQLPTDPNTFRGN